jgi:hypothetical protein
MKSRMPFYSLLRTCFLIVLGVAITATGFAQRPTSGSSTTGCYRQPVSPISTIPTLHTDMTPDCLLGYIYLDSLCRSFPNWDSSERFYQSLPNYLNSYDTLRVFMRFYYRMQEYDADLLNEYELAAQYLDTSYKMMPGALEALLWKQMNKVLMPPQQKLNFLSTASLILHIRVLDTIGSQDSNCVVPVWPQPRMCVSAQVIDTIKGLHFRPGDCGPYTPNSKKKNGATPTGTGVVPCINIDYSTLAEKRAGPMSDILPDPMSDPVSGAIIPCSTCYGSNALLPGKDYIVFLSSNFLDYNGTTSFYEYCPYNGFNNEGGIFPIDSIGNVLIQDNYFGYGTSVPLSTFEANIYADIQSIVSH